MPQVGSDRDSIDMEPVQARKMARLLKHSNGLADEARSRQHRAPAH
jgi:hypothetical protein